MMLRRIDIKKPQPHSTKEIRFNAVEQADHLPVVATPRCPKQNERKSMLIQK